MAYQFKQKGDKLIQIDRCGFWHGYVSCYYKDTFKDEQEAIAWLEAQQTNAPGVYRQKRGIMFYAKIYNQGQLVGYVEADVKAKAMAIADDYEPDVKVGSWFQRLTEEKPTEQINLLASWTDTELPVYHTSNRDARLAIAKLNAQIDDCKSIIKAIYFSQRKIDPTF